MLTRSALGTVGSTLLKVRRSALLRHVRTWPVIVAALLLAACGPSAPAVEQTPPTPIVLSTPAAERTPNAVEHGGKASRQYGKAIGFRSRKNLAEHFDKHGREFGDVTLAAYLEQAQALRDASVSNRVLEIRRDDGVVSRFDRDSGSFLAFNLDGTIRTFFRPNDGERYFRRQAKRRPIP
jgi:hypothetical protein